MNFPWIFYGCSMNYSMNSMNVPLIFYELSMDLPLIVYEISMDVLWIFYGFSIFVSRCPEQVAAQLAPRSGALLHQLRWRPSSGEISGAPHDLGNLQIYCCITYILFTDIQESNLDGNIYRKTIPKKVVTLW